MKHFKLWIVLLMINSCHPVLSNVNLTCYSCTHKFIQIQDLTGCLNHLTEDFVQMCTANQNYCQIKNTITYGNIKVISRGCSSRCENKCKYILFGIRKKICSSCCEQSLCNNGIASEAEITIPVSVLYLMNTVLLTLVINMV